MKKEIFYENLERIENENFLENLERTETKETEAIDLARNKKYENKQMNESEEKVMSSTKTETRIPKTKTGTVINSIVVKIRKAPNTESEVLELLRKGDKVKIYKKLNNGFYEISTNVNKKAYIHSNYIRED